VRVTPSSFGPSPGPHGERGVAVIAVALLLVVLASTAVFMVTMSGVSHMSTTLSAGAMQAWFAARAGLEWAVQQATSRQANHDLICDDGGTVLTTFTLDGGAAAGFAITVTCDDQGGFQEAGASYEVDAITVTASRGAPSDIDFVTRTVQAVVTTGEPLPP